MSFLPPPNTPLNQHSLVALELWLSSIGASKSKENPSIWLWSMHQCSAEINMKKDELSVVWLQGDKKSQFSFSYGLPRKDVEDALRQGP